MCGGGTCSLPRRRPGRWPRDKRKPSSGPKGAEARDRAGVVRDLDGAEAYEVLLTELKAAAVDVACDRAMARGAEVVFVDNRAVVVEGDTDLPTALRETVGLAGERSARRNEQR